MLAQRNPYGACGRPRGDRWMPLAALAALVFAAPALADDGGARRFVAERSAFTVGQAPDWVDRDTIVWHAAIPPEEGGDGKAQVVTSALDGSRLRCLTCGLPGPTRCRWRSRAVTGSCSTRGTATR